MTDQALIRLSRVIAAVTVLCGVLTVIVIVTPGSGVRSAPDLFQELAGTLIVPAVVLITIPKVPRNGSVWAFAIVGLSLGFVVLGDAVAESVAGITSEAINDSQIAVGVAPSDIPLAAAVGIAVALSMWIPSFVLLPTFVLLLFPDGEFPDPESRWRWVGRLSVATAIAGMLAYLWQYRPTSTTSYDDLVSELSFANVVGGVGSLVFVLLAVIAIVGYVIKWRRATGDTRLQYRWVGFAFFAFAIYSVASVVLSPIDGSQISDIVSWAMIIFIPVAYSVAILKYRLYGIDVIVGRSLTFGVLAVFITAVYAVIVVGIGSFVGGGDEPSLALSITAVAVVAVAFEPVRRRVQHWANVVVYGKRATPYEVLASATARLSDTSDPDEALARVTQLVVDGTGAVEAVLWLKIGDVMYPRASSPGDAVEGLDPVSVDDPVATIVGDRVVAVRHRGDVLGALSISKDRADAVTGSEEKVLEDVAAGAGVLLRNMGLNAELAEQAEQLRVSRRRLVATHDAERRRLERDLHDGAQQQLVALKVKLGIARTLAEREGAQPVADLVASLSDTTQEAVDGMRAVAHGIYPPLLESEGLEAALGGMRRTVPIPVEITADGIQRYERSVEESIYFCVVEVVARAIDRGASELSISLRGVDRMVRFSVATDGDTGDLISVEDRLDALSGTLCVHAEVDRTTVVGEMPAGTHSLEPA